MTDKHAHTNALIEEESPYLLQHAHNPVHWQAWSENAWKQAKEEGKLVLVSIGYSTCHWCHVMERESFEDQEVADLMNEKYICIKVDREEHPDVDQVYMDACQLMTGRGGWPLNVICLPDKRPIYAGTYFPRAQWLSILGQLDSLWLSDQARAAEYALKVEKGLQQINLNEFAPRSAFAVADIHGLSEKLSEVFDMEYGGLRRSQKFPLPSIYEYLLDDYLSTGRRESLDFVNFTLIRMANSGIYDQLRGGFYRYATDRQWFAPHFEKMLYDNAQLLSLYSRAFAVTGAPLYREIAEGIISFADRELYSGSSGYYAALDADSEGTEGRFYVFTYPELESVLSSEELSLAQLVYNLKEEGNWEHGYNILHKTLSPAELVNQSGLDAHSFMDKLQAIRQKLFGLQEQRVRPGLDRKIICSWNGLMLKGLADAGRFMSRPDWKEKAEALAEALLRDLTRNKRLLRQVSSKEEPVPAFSEDYACMITGLVALYEATGKNRWLEEALSLTRTMMRDFFDPEKQLFTFTPLKEEALLLHKTDLTDDVIPSSNALMCMALQKLGILKHNTGWYQSGREMIQRVRSRILEQPEWYSCWAMAAQSEAFGLIQVVLTDTGDSQRRALHELQLPGWALKAFATDDSPELVLEKKSGRQGFYICKGETCFEPVSEPAQLAEIIDDLLARA